MQRYKSEREWGNIGSIESADKDSEVPEYCEDLSILLIFPFVEYGCPLSVARELLFKEILIENSTQLLCFNLDC